MLEGLLMSFRLGSPHTHRFQKGKTMLLCAVGSWILSTLAIGFIQPAATSCVRYNGTHHILENPYSKVRSLFLAIVLIYSLHYEVYISWYLVHKTGWVSSPQMAWTQAFPVPFTWQLWYSCCYPLLSPVFLFFSYVQYGHHITAAHSSLDCIIPSINFLSTFLHTCS